MAIWGYFQNFVFDEKEGRGRKAWKRAYVIYEWSQKREELSRFEMTLKQMIEEAKQMAATPSGSDEDLYARSLHKSPSVRHYSYFSNKRVGLNKRVV